MNIRTLTTLVVVLAGVGSAPVLAQTLDQMIQNQMRMQRYGDQRAAQLYQLCITHPGACAGADPYATQRAVQNYANRSYQMQQHNWGMMQRNWQANDDWNHRAIQNCVKLWNPAGYAYWSCPNGTQNTITGR